MQALQIQTPRDVVRDVVVPIMDLALVLDEWYRQGPAYVDDQSVEVIASRGVYAVAIFDEYDSGYPYRRGWKKAIIPTNRTLYLIVRVERRDNTVDPPIYYVDYYVYVKGFGWWRFERSDAIKVTKVGVPKEKLNEVVENMVIYGDG